MAFNPYDAPTPAEVAREFAASDENGTLLFQVVRFEPKDFRQRRPDGRGGWIWNVRDARRVLYRLPELLKAVAAGETIYIPEGEKDVDNLRALEVFATTNPGGIKKWRDDYSEFLCGADVVVLPDNHAEGREHGEPCAALPKESASLTSASTGPPALRRATSRIGSPPAARLTSLRR